MNDPFERAKSIRQGTLDHELPDYEELTGWLQRVPQTWLPGLLAACVHQCVVQVVFQEGRLVDFVKVAEERASDPMSILRGVQNTKSPATAAGAPVAAGDSAPAASSPPLCPKDGTPMTYANGKEHYHDLKYPHWRCELWIGSGVCGKTAPLESK